MTVPDSNATPPADPATPPAGTPPATPPVETPPPTPPKDNEDDLPEWARTELKKVRGEAAGYRTRLRDAETKLSQAKTPEEFAAAVTEVQEKNAELERSLMVTTVATKYALPPELAARLKGTTEVELEADAKELQKFVVPANEVDLDGGLTPGSSRTETDPRKLAQAHGRRR